MYIHAHLIRVYIYINWHCFKIIGVHERHTNWKPSEPNFIQTQFGLESAVAVAVAGAPQPVWWKMKMKSLVTAWECTFSISFILEIFRLRPASWAVWIGLSVLPTLAFGIIDFCVCFPGRNGSLEKWQLPTHTDTHTEKPCEWWVWGLGRQAGTQDDAGTFFLRKRCVYIMPFSHGRNTDTFHVSNDSNFTLISSAFDLPNWQNSISANTFSMDTPTHTRNHARTHSLVETHTHTNKWILKRYATGTHSRGIAGRVLRTPVHWLLGGVFVYVIY